MSAFIDWTALKLPRRGAIVACGLCLLSSSASEGAVWTVEKDGSGDFQVIQDAVEAAASGDTIQIGEGRFLEFHPVVVGQSSTTAHVYTDHEELTIVGVGADVTIIGPATDDEGHWSHGIATGENSRLHVHGLTTEYCARGITHYGPYLEVTGFRARWSGTGIISFDCEGAEIRDSELLDNQYAGIGLVQGYFPSDIIVENCVVTGGTGVMVVGDRVLIRDCTFESTYVGVRFTSSRGTVERCRFRNTGSPAIWVSRGSLMELVDCRVGESATNISVEWSGLTGSGNVLEGGTLYTLYMSANSHVDFHDNHILNAGGWSAYVERPSDVEVEFDLRNNYWGTTDAGQIEEWIRDGADGADNTRVLFEPFHAEPIPTGRTSLSRLKSLFHR